MKKILGVFVSVPPLKMWTVESAKNESIKYGSRSEFKRMNRGAFNFLYKRNMIDETAFENNWK